MPQQQLPQLQVQLLLSKHLQQPWRQLQQLLRQQLQQKLQQKKQQKLRSYAIPSILEFVYAIL